MHTIYKLENVIREYSWGSRTAFPALFNKKEPAKNPQAELWMGAHPIAPSFAIAGGKRISLADLIGEKPVEILGYNSTKKFGNSLPFLFKILAAEKPLSIQAHPDKRQAEEGFSREEKAGIPRMSPNRVYRDENHKPELICALTPFWALCGFRPFGDIAESFGSVSVSEVRKEAERFARNQSPSGLETFYEYVMTLDSGLKQKLIADVTDGSKGNATDDRRKWMMSVRSDYPSDIGIVSFLFLNLVELKPQEALFLPAKRLHSYLSGIGIEIMANSDNVVRGGLTEKHVDVPELLRILSFESGVPEVIHSVKNAPHEEKYHCDAAAEFALTRITLSKQSYRPLSEERNVEIIVVADGNGAIEHPEAGTRISLERGDSCIIPAAVKDYVIDGKLVLYKATVPTEGYL